MKLTITDEDILRLGKILLAALIITALIAVPDVRF